MNTLKKSTENGAHAEKAKILLDAIRSTTDDRVLGALRLLLGGLFVMTGLMKLYVPMLGEAFSGQLLAAHIPFYEFTIWFVPITEVAIGALLLVGLFSRIGGLVAINMMIVATYVHLVVGNPDLFPLQPEA